MKRTYLKRQSTKRRKENAEYMKVRDEYLKEHPYCEWWLHNAGLKESDVSPMGTVEMNRGFDMIIYWVPKANQIHHKKGRGKYLCVKEFFMAVSDEGHRWIHAHPKESYEREYMLPRR